MVRLCSIIAGIVIISGIINSFIQTMIDVTVKFLDPDIFNRKKMFDKQKFLNSQATSTLIKPSSSNIILNNANDVAEFPITMPVTN